MASTGETNSPFHRSTHAAQNSHSVLSEQRAVVMNDATSSPASALNCYNPMRVPRRLNKVAHCFHFIIFNEMQILLISIIDKDITQHVY